MVELAVIPVIFVVNTFVSYLCAILVAKLFRFSKRPRNFVIAMGVSDIMIKLFLQTLTLSTDLWQCKFPSHLSGYLPIGDAQGPSLG